MIDHTNLEDYTDPIIYDAENAENAQFETDWPFYLSLAQRIGGPVLELGCGTGRVTLQLAREGIEITGLDIAPEMLAHAQQKAEREGLSIPWVDADVRTFQLDQQFRLIIATGGVFNMLLTRPDQAAALAQIREHLLPDGVFATDVVVPQPSWMSTQAEDPSEETYQTEDGREVTASITGHYDPIHQVVHEAGHRRWRDAEGQVVSQEFRFAFRYIFPYEMASLLHYNGFDIINRYADGKFEPTTVESKNIFYICQISE